MLFFFGVFFGACVCVPFFFFFEAFFYKGKMENWGGLIHLDIIIFYYPEN